MKSKQLINCLNNNVELKKALFLLIVVLLSANIVNSQERHFFSIDLGFTQNHKGFFSLYSGLVDLGGGYHLRIFNHLNSGISLHVNYFKRSNTTASLVIYKPKINLGYDFPVHNKIDIVTQISAGYAILRNSNKEFIYRETKTGLNASAEVKLLWKSITKLNFYLFGRYDYIYLDKDAKFTILEYYRQVNLTAFGLGIRIK
jgi:hypothetical protein